MLEKINPVIFIQPSLNGNIGPAKITNNEGKEKVPNNDSSLTTAGLQTSNDQISIGFTRDPIINKQIVTVKNKDSDEVVVQIPTEASIKMSQQLDQIKGKFFDITTWFYVVLNKIFQIIRLNFTFK